MDGMEYSASPLQSRRRLRTELRKARLKKELTQQQVAEAMEWSLSKAIRVETANFGISTHDLRALLRLYEITDLEQTAELLGLARRAKQPAWWLSYGDVASPAILQLIDYESAASAVSQFETIDVPGVLQTEEYASAVLQAFHAQQFDTDIDALIELYSRRSDLLYDQNAPEFSFLLDQSVLHRVVGTPTIMRRQLHNLAYVAELPNITIQIVPFTAGPLPRMREPFEIVQFDHNPNENIVFIGGPSGEFISDDPAGIQGYLEAFENIRAASLGPTDSVLLLRRAAEELM